jgi:hypothetical protein
MAALLVSLLMLVQGVPSDAYTVQLELQGLYDEASQIMLISGTCVDFDTAHAVLATPDWVFVDANGARRTWDDVRRDALQLIRTRFKAIYQKIEKVTPTAEGAVVLISMTTEKAIRDDEGVYGTKGGAHILADVMRFRDTWVKTSGGWRQKIRETIGRTESLLDGKPIAGRTRGTL